jgi:two-component system response regulator YesN
MEINLVSPMGITLLVFSNILVPIVTGIFFFIYFLYFVIVNHSKAASFRYFLIFLISFSLFLVSRPLQLLLGQHPVQLIIVNIRMIIFCGFSITSITIASNLFSNKKSLNSRWIIYGIGFLFGTIYVVFNSLGTIGSVQIFTWSGMIAHDALTPALLPPYYGREVTIGLQVTIGFLLCIVSIVNIFSRTPKEQLSLNLKNKIVLFNIGVLIFGFSFIVGSFTKQWWIYYFFSMFSTFLIGAGVVIDIRELYNNYERLIPIIKEDIVQNVAFSPFSLKKLKNLLSCMGKSDLLDTFAVLEIQDNETNINFESQAIDQISQIDSATKIISNSLDHSIGYGRYLIVPLDGQKIGVVFQVFELPTLEEVSSIALIEAAINALEKKGFPHISAGIGRSYRRLEDLRTSYHEALSALEFSKRLGNYSLIHVSNIQHDLFKEASYPIKEKMQLLSTIKLGDLETSLKALDEFLSIFHVFILKRPEAMKLRLYELSGSLIDNAILVGGDEVQLNRLVKESFNDITYLSTFDQIEGWLKELIERIISFVNRVQKTRTSVIIDKAKLLVAERLDKQISYHEIAKELYISSSYFQALFKQEVGSTFVEYLTDLRINRAKELLLNSAMTITEISFEVGIQNPNYFSSMFHKKTGVSAKTFRKRNTN